MRTSSPRLNQIIIGALILLSGAVATRAQVPQLLNYQGRIAVNGTNFTGTGQFKFALVSASTNASVQATAEGIVFYGFLVHIAVNNGGSGYTTPPAVTIADSTGIGATASAQISGGVVTNIVVTSVGFGYSGSPMITIDTPPAQNVVVTFWSNDGTSNAGEPPTSSVPLTVNKGLYSVLLGDTTLSNMAALPTEVLGYSNVRLRTWFNDGTTGFQQLTPDQRLSAVGYAVMSGAAQTVPDGSITANKIATGAVGSSQLAQNLNIAGTVNVGNLLVNGSTPNAKIRYQFPTTNGTSAYLQTSSGGNYFLDGSISNIILPTNAVVGETIRLYFPRNDFGGLPNNTFSLIQNPGQRIAGWRPINPQNILSQYLAASFDLSCLMVGLMDQGFLISTNSGLGWGVQPASLPWIPQWGYRTFTISGDGSHIYLDADGRLFVSQDSGQSWIQTTNFDQQFGMPNGFSCSSNGNKVAMISQNGIFISVDSGSNWTQQATISGGPSIASSGDGSRLVASAGNGIYVSNNSGLGWLPQTNGLPINGSASYYSVASSADGKTFMAASSVGIFISTNSGLDWSLDTGAPNTSFQAIASSADGSVLAAVTGSAIYISNDSGYSWYSRLNGTNLFSVVVSADGDKLIAAGNMGLYVSTDSGDTWNTCSTLPSNPFLTPYTISNIGPSGGATFSPLWGSSLVLVYLGNGMFTQLSESSPPYLNCF